VVDGDVVYMPKCLYLVIIIKYIKATGILIIPTLFQRHMQWCSWLRYCATSQKVAGSIPKCVTGIFVDLMLPATLWPWGGHSQ
jgi:hypothetical protein